MSETFSCLSCGAAASRAVHINCRDYYLRTAHIVSYYRCQACGLQQQSPVPSDTAALYTDYPIHAKKSRLFDAARRIMLGGVYYRPAASVCKLLDFGCGDGSYLKSIRRAGLTAVEYEPDSTLARRLSDTDGVAVYSQLDNLLELHESTFDIVTMHFVLEHLPDLHAAFDIVSRLLRPGGIFYFVVPQSSSLEAELFGRRWHGLDPPRHISFPEPAVVAALAAQHRFAVTAHRAVPFPNGFAGSIPVVLLGRFSFPLFALSWPLGMIFSWIWPTGARRFELRKLP